MVNAGPPEAGVCVPRRYYHPRRGVNSGSVLRGWLWCWGATRSRCPVAGHGGTPAARRGPARWIERTLRCRGERGVRLEEAGAGGVSTPAEGHERGIGMAVRVDVERIPDLTAARGDRKGAALEDRLDLGLVQAVVLLEDESRGRGHVRRGHRGAADVEEVAGVRADDVGHAVRPEREMAVARVAGKR